VLHLLGLGRQDDRIAGVDDRGGRLHEDQGNLRHVVAELLGVLDVVASHAYDLAWHRWCGQPDLAQGRAGHLPLEFSKEIAFDIPDLVVMKPAVARGFVIDLVTNDAHVVLLDFMALSLAQFEVLYN
jgi:hypothetical protein